MKNAIQANEADNVATLLADVEGEQIGVVGCAPQVLPVPGSVRSGHKVAVRPIPPGSAVLKYGMPIGRATRAIAPGEWVHLHNCASNYDERSNTLDNETGAPTDSDAAYE